MDNAQENKEKRTMTIIQECPPRTDDRKEIANRQLSTQEREVN
jgi:hypothetical protein